MQSLIIVNGCPHNILSDANAKGIVEPLQIQFDRDFLPAWGAMATPVSVSFAPASEIPRLPSDAWVIFLNRHSTDAGALGWHDDEDGKIFSRVFVGDCLRLGLDWNVTLSHEALEMDLDPDVRRTWRMPDGRLAAFEACDACEDDRYGYFIKGRRVSDFVLPSYFGTRETGQYDYMGVLPKPCPALSPGGYMSISDGSEWTQIQADKVDGLAGMRAIVPGHRRQVRSRRSGGILIEMDVTANNIRTSSG